MNQNVQSLTEGKNLPLKGTQNPSAPHPKEGEGSLKGIQEKHWLTKGRAHSILGKFPWMIQRESSWLQTRSSNEVWLQFSSPAELHLQPGQVWTVVVLIGWVHEHDKGRLRGLDCEMPSNVHEALSQSYQVFGKPCSLSRPCQCGYTCHIAQGHKRNTEVKPK